MTQDFSVVFVCLGNICRSPTAHGALRNKVATAGLSDFVTVDSAGTGSWHVGSPPDLRAQKTASSYDVSIDDLRARQVDPVDLTRFDYVIAMDRQNYTDLRSLAVEHGLYADRISLLTDWGEGESIDGVPDPYAGGQDGFRHVFELIDAHTDGVIDALRTDLHTG